MNQFVRGFASVSKSIIKCHRLDGKVAIVTGSTEGIGFSSARRLGQEGAKVMVSSRNEAHVLKATTELRLEGLDVSGVTCHVGNEEHRKNLVNETISKYGGLDILVLNAAVNPSINSVLECPESVWDKIFDINVKSTVFLIKESLPYLRKSKSPSIIIMSTAAAYQTMNLQQLKLQASGVYSASKTTLLALNRIISDELCSEGIRINVICPGLIKTKFGSVFYKPEVIDGVMSLIPMDRLGRTDEIASIVAFLASDDSSYITGESIVASGGAKSRL